MPAAFHRSSSAKWVPLLSPREMKGVFLSWIFLNAETISLPRAPAGSDFGPEAVAELMVRMVGDADQLVVAAAGYTKEMREFLESNTGFQSRFTDEFAFDHYKPDELVGKVYYEPSDQGLEKHIGERLNRLRHV